MFKDDVSLSQVKDEVIFHRKGEAVQIRLREKSLCCNGFWLAENIPHEELRSSMLGKDEVASSNLASSSKNQSSHPGRLIFCYGYHLNWRPHLFQSRGRKGSHKTVVLWEDGGQFKSGERRERCRWQRKRPERVAAVGRCRTPQQDSSVPTTERMNPFPTRLFVGNAFMHSACGVPLNMLY